MKTRFRFLVSLELLLLISYWVWLIAAAHQAGSPEEMQPSVAEAPAPVTLMEILVVYAGSLLQIVGLIGLILLCGWARHTYCLGMVFSLAAIAGAGTTASSSVITGLLSGAFWMNAGAILALSYNRLVWNSFVSDATRSKLESL